MDSVTSIPASRLKKQALFYYLAPICWMLYLFTLPAVFSVSHWYAIFYLIFPGLFLFTWIGYLMHESWHKYVPAINNRVMYHLLALFMLTDPQLYHLIHGSHHAQVHTWNDREFHPCGEIGSRGWRIVYNWLEVLLGVVFLELVASITVPRDSRFAGRYHHWKLFISILLWCMLFGGIGYLSWRIFGVAPSDIVVSYLVMFWGGSFFLHHSQLIEHGNLIVEGDFHQRNIVTRNLRPAGIVEKFFLFLTHNDSREHVLHHTLTKVYTRPFCGAVPLPEHAVQITIREYAVILRRMLCGKVDREIAPLKSSVKRPLLPIASNHEDSTG